MLDRLRISIRAFLRSLSSLRAQALQSCFVRYAKFRIYRPDMVPLYGIRFCFPSKGNCRFEIKVRGIALEGQVRNSTANLRTHN